MFENGINVLGAHIDSPRIDIKQNPLYEDDNLAAEIRKENPNDSRSLYQYPYHIIGAGYSKEICGKEFLTRHIQDGEVGKEELLLRSNGQDEVLLTYYEDVVILGKQIIYFDSVDKNKLSVYDIDTQESLIFYEFKDGTFEFTAVEDNIVYGIWNSIKQSKSYFVGIDMGTFEMTSYFATDKGVDYLLLNKTIYYVNKEITIPVGLTGTSGISSYQYRIDKLSQVSSS